DTLLNYFNPDDYALAGWRLDQALKPTSVYPLSSPLDTETINSIRGMINFGNVDLLAGGTLLDLWYALTGRSIPGFANTQYSYVPFNGINAFDRSSSTASVRLNLNTNLYEMFALCASSIVAAVGDVNSMAG